MIAIVKFEDPANCPMYIKFIYTGDDKTVIVSRRFISKKIADKIISNNNLQLVSTEYARCVYK